MATPPSHTLAAMLVAELTRSLQADLPDLTARATTGETAGDGWRLQAQVSGPFDGVATLWIDRAGALALMAHLPDAVPEPGDEAVVASLDALWLTVTGATALGAAFHDLVLQPSGVEAGSAPPATTTVELAAGDTRARVAAAAVLRPLAPGADAPGHHGSPHIEALLDIDLPLVVRFARTTMSIKTLSSVGPGTIVDMERAPDAPVELLVGDRVIAEGEVVVVGGNYGVRVTKLCTPATRARAVEA